MGRVARRAREGGHNIPPDVVHRRYVGGIRNVVRLYLPLADEVFIYDNSEGGMIPVAEKFADAELVVYDQGVWARIQEVAR